MKKNATVKIVLNPQSNETLKSVKLRITFNRVTRFRAIPSDIKLTDDEFANEKLKKTKEVMAVARKAHSAAETICDELGASFTWIEFDLRYNKSVWSKETLVDIDGWDTLLEAYFNKKSLAYSTQDNYKNAVKWIKRYQPTSTVADVTEEFVKGWIAYMRKTYKKTTKQEISVNTLGMYIRAIRALYNYAVTKKLVVDTHPFAGVLESAPRQKTSVPSADWIKFANYKPEEGSNLEFAHDFARLSFALGGANMKDILSFKNSNVDGNYITFTRVKTERVGTVVRMPLSGVAKAIIEKYGVLNPKKPNAYIFPFFTADMTEKSLYYKRDSILKKVNGGISDICEVLGIDAFTTYNIRHTFAVLTRDKKGFTVEQLSKLLGHKNVTTTQIYLNSITQELMDDTKDFLDEVLGDE